MTVSWTIGGIKKTVTISIAEMRALLTLKASTTDKMLQMKIARFIDLVFETKR